MTPLLDSRTATNGPPLPDRHFTGKLLILKKTMITEADKSQKSASSAPLARSALAATWPDHAPHGARRKFSAHARLTADIIECHRLKTRVEELGQPHPRKALKDRKI